MKQYILNRKTRQVEDASHMDMLEYAAWFGKDGNRRVALTQITNDIKVSTVFLGYDNSFGYGDGPVLFETMVFGGEYNENYARTATLDEAEQCHEDAVEFVCRNLRDIEVTHKLLSDILLDK